jgi:xylan 1,4-beta-xylosidase
MFNTNKITYLFVIIALIVFRNQSTAQVLPRSKQTTICNPVNLNYRFCLDTPSRREAADPTVINFKNEYYLFASKSGGYWHSTNLIQWDLITSKDLPLEDYAPTAVVMDDTVYFMASSGKQGSKIYKTADPKTGQWQVANDTFPISLTDPALFFDDGHLYLYYGCSNVNPIYAVELSRKTLMPIGEPVACFNSNKDIHGWERAGDYNDKPDAPWIEGAWMTKYNGKCYLQYAAPGTQFKSYCDGMYIADKPLGPFHLAENNPFSSKPEGFISGAGHSSLFKDNYGNYWQISTITISIKHMFERRLALFPAFFDTNGNSYAYTKFGDFPYIVPKKKIISPAELSPHWMLLSYKKPVMVSSVAAGHAAVNAVDEDVRTYWSAASGNNNEWISIDLQEKCTVNAIQINFAEQGTKIYGRTRDIHDSYKLEYSNDNKTWKLVADKSLNGEDAPHDYMELRFPVKTRYWRITNIHTPDGNFAISGFRIFGTAGSSLPQKVVNIHATRNTIDPCIVNLQWMGSKTAIGYNIKYGSSPDKLYHNYQVFHKNSLIIRNLNKDQHYYFTVDSFNENGEQEGRKTIFVK